MTLPIKRLNENAVLPQYMSEGAAAVDLCACLETDLLLGVGERALVPTGIAIAAPRGTVALLFSRSGLAAKNGIALSNGVGVIDSDYRGEVKVALYNSGSEPFVVTHGMRIAQLALFSVLQPECVVCEELSETARHAGGFGSTGV